ncbi:hypothetical protein ACA910_017213 [Epithemia clementina (nom. ined.)]
MEEVENLASRLVDCVREFIDELRSFKDLPTTTTTTPSLSLVTHQLKQQRASYQSYDDNVVVGNSHHDQCNQEMHDLAFHVQELTVEIKQCVSRLSCPANSSQTIAARSAVDNQSASSKIVGQSSSGIQWDFAVYHIVYPLLDNLIRCYSVLDAQQEPAPAPPLIDHENKNKNNSARLTRQKQNQKPKPPPGMLSIQNYTDIAILLEFAVCSSILPLLDVNVRPPTLNRVKSLPRSLAGRTPIQAIQQASACRDHVNVKGSNALVERRQELLSTAALVGSVVLLDRFRPMLLPRHFADIYAALFQSEQLKLSPSPQSLDKKGPSPSPPVLEDLQQRIESMLLETNGEILVNSPIMAARAFQELLLQGRKGPYWLRHRVSGLLNHLATTNLVAVVDVFVLASPDDKTAAALRLAKALTLGHKDNKNVAESNDIGTQSCRSEQEEFFLRLGQQLLLVMDRSIQQVNQKFDSASIQFLWMTLNELPDCVLEATFFSAFARPFRAEPTATNSDKQHEHVSIHHTIRRMEKLLSIVPPGVDQARFCRLVLLRPLKHFCLETTQKGIDVTLLGVLLRLCSAPAILKDAVKLDALRALRLVVEFLSSSSFSIEGDSIDGTQVAVASLVYSLVPTTWDLAPMRFRFPPNNYLDQSESTALSGVAAYQDETSTLIDVSTLVADVQRYAKYAIHNVVLNCWTGDRDNGSSPDTVASTISMLPSLLLEFLLVVYLRSGDEHSLSQQTSVQSSSLLLTAMVATPLLCEICPMESLVFGGNGQFRLLWLIRTVLESLSSIQDGNYLTDDAKSIAKSTCGTFQSAEQLVFKFLSCPVVDTLCNWISKESVSEFGVSLAAVLLNMLACILELGAIERSKQEEIEILDLVPSLESLARVDSIRRKGIDSSQWAEINEAASHILILIALRKQEGGSFPAHKLEIETTSKKDVLTQARLDLESKEAPIRASGIASLRRILTSGENWIKEAGASRIVEVVEDSEVKGEGEHAHAEDIFMLLVKALADSESYVYLAAIHTLAIMSSSRQFFPIMMEGIATGALVALGQRQLLSLDQRVKLTEVTITVLRRSPSALHDHAASVFDVLLYGKATSETRTTKYTEIQKITLDFFEQSDSPMSEDKDCDWQEKKIRLNTGGPLFKVEEPDLIRAALLSLASETVILAPPALSARYCAGLMECSIKSLSFQTARTIRRSGALLAYSLFSAVIREMEEAFLVDGAMKQCPMTMAMIKSGEDVLAAILGRCCAGIDSSDGSLADPATVARCEEALAARDRAENGGMLAAGRIALDRARQDNTFLVDMLASK